MSLWSLSAYPETLSMRGLTLSEGLSDLLVNAIYKDSLGYLWFGTAGSLDCFDGAHIRQYPVAGADERLKRVNAIAELAGNEIWMGNGAGLWRLNRRQGRLERMMATEIDCAVHTLHTDGSGTLYAGTQHGLFIFRAGRVEQWQPEGNILSSANDIYGITTGDRAGELWLTTAQGLYAFEEENHVFRYYRPQTLSGEHPSSFRGVTRIGNNLYIATVCEGLLAFNLRTRTFSNFVDVGCNIISSLSGDGKNTLYVGTDGNGAHFVDVRRRAVVRSFRHRPEPGEIGIRSNSVYSLLVDRDGLVWIGYYQQGLDYTLFQNHLFSVYEFPPHFQSGDVVVRSICIRGSEKLIGSRGGLYYIDEASNRFAAFVGAPLRSGVVFCICPYGDEYCIGTYGGGMFLFDPKTLRLRDFEPGVCPFDTGNIFCFCKDPNDDLWIGTSKGVYCYSGGRQKYHFTHANSKLPSNNVFEIFFDSSHKGWVCTEAGMCLWDPSACELRNDVFPEGFAHREKMRVVYEDAAHQLYFFPDKGPLFISDLKMSRFRRVGPGTPLEGKNGMFVFEDERHGLWLGTDNGLFLRDREGRFTPYTFFDGIPDPVFTLCPPVRDEQGRTWFANSGGLLYMDDARLSVHQSHAYPLQVTEVTANANEPVAVVLEDGQPGVHLTAQQNNVTFRFSDFSFTAPDDMAYEYLMDNVDSTWTALHGHSSVSYYHLPSGLRRFRVRCMGQPDTETVLAVQVDYPRYILVGLAGVAVLLVLLVGSSVVRFRRAYIEEEEERVRPAAEPAMVERVPDDDETEAASEAALVEKYRTVSVSAEECERLACRLERVMREERPYMQPDLKVADLAARLDISAHTLSYLFSQHLQRNYYDYINDFRIEEFKRLVDTDEQGKYTLTALSERCGFSSRASFFRYFKKSTGITPSEYIKHSRAQKTPPTA